MPKDITEEIKTDLFFEEEGTFSNTPSKQDSPKKKTSQKEPSKFVTPFRLQKLFGDKKEIQLSFREIAEFFKVHERTAKKYVQDDVENGYITKHKTDYKCNKYRTLLSGKNIYRVVPPQDGGGKQNAPSKPPQRKNILFFEKNAKDNVWDGFSFSEGKKQLYSFLEGFGFEYLAFKAPLSWMQSKELLGKTLILLHRKKQKGYRVRNEIAWISNALKERGVGYRKKIAKTYFVSLENLRNGRRDPLYHSAYPPVQAGLETLAYLSKEGLDTSEKALQKLLRKGFAFLSHALRVFGKVSKGKEIQNKNAFLNWIVGLKSPEDVFEKRLKTPKQKIEFAKAFFLEHKEYFLFLKATDVFPKLKSIENKEPPHFPNKMPLCFLVHKTDPEKSHIIFQRNGAFKQTLSISDPDFEKKFFAFFRLSKSLLKGERAA